MKNKLEVYLEIYSLLYKQQNLVDREFTRILKEINLSFQQFLFLYFIENLKKESDTVRSSDIIEIMGIGRAAVSRLGGRIEELGLITRHVFGTKEVTFELTDLGVKNLKLGLELITKDGLNNQKISNLNKIKKQLIDLNQNK